MFRLRTEPAARDDVDRFFTAIANGIARFVGDPVAFILAFLTVVVWAVTGPMFHYSDTWQLVINTGTTIVTFLMVFLIQNSQNRDAAAMQAKLDEIIRAIEEARGQFIGIEHKTDKEIQEIRAELEQECAEEEEQQESPRKPRSNTYVERLQRRR
jgi:low affinity Fe/Cu permease